MLDPQSGLLEVGIARNRRPVTHFTNGLSIVIIPHPTPSTTKLLGYIGFTSSVRPLSVRPSVRPSLRPSVPHPVSALYRLQFWLDPFHIYTSYQATSEGVSRVKFLVKSQDLNFWHFFKFVTLICLVLTWDQI